MYSVPFPRLGFCCKCVYKTKWVCPFLEIQISPDKSWKDLIKRFKETRRKPLNQNVPGSSIELQKPKTDLMSLKTTDWFWECILNIIIQQQRLMN